MKDKILIVIIGLVTGCLTTLAILFGLSFIQAKENALIMQGADLAIQQVINTVNKEGSVTFQHADSKGNQTVIKLILDKSEQPRTPKP